MKGFSGILFFFIVLRTHAYAQEEVTKFDHLSSKHGLSNNQINCIYQDTQGFIWLGTAGGLNRFDGHSVLVFENDPEDSTSISSDYILSIYEDITGTLWIGTFEGLNKLNRETRTFERFTHQAKDRYSISDNQIKCIFEDKKGLLWIGTYKGLNQFDRQTKRFTLFQHSPGHKDNWQENSVNRIYEDRLGTMWVGTTKGVSYFDRSTHTFTRFQFEGDKNVTHEGTVTGILEDTEGRLWISTQGDGLKVYDQITRTVTYYRQDLHNPNSIPSNFILSLLEDSQGAIWVGTQEAGLLKFDKRTNRFESFRHDVSDPNSMVNNTITCIVEDKLRVLWFGTFAGGVDRLDLLKKKFTHYKYCTFSKDDWDVNYIGAILEDRKGRVWIGSTRKLSVMDRQRKTSVHYLFRSPVSEKISNNNPQCLYEDKAGNIWVGHGGGVQKFDPEKKLFTLSIHSKVPTYLGSISSIYQDHAGRMWVGSMLGLLNVDVATHTYRVFKPKNLPTKPFFVTSILEDDQGLLWVSSGIYGLYTFDPVKNSFIRYAMVGKSGKRPEKTGINCMVKDTKGKLWLALASGGIRVFDPRSRTFAPVRQSNKELIKVVASGIAEDEKGNFWISTLRNGIYRYNPAAASVTNYDERDGLQGNEFTAGFCRGNSGHMYFSGKNGFTAFHPDRITYNPYAPSVVISSFKVFDKPRSFHTREVELNYDENFFSFEFAALSFACPEKNQYLYKMEGFDQAWIYAGARRYASYTNLDPGEYVLKIKASNHDGVFNETGTWMKISIRPPFWKTYGAYSIYFLLFVVVLYASWKYTVSRERLKSDLKLKSLESEKLQEVDQLKSKFFTNVSHELRTPLSLIIGPAQRLISEKIEGDELQEYHQLIYRSAARLKDMINQVLDLSKVEAGKMRLNLSSGDMIAFIQHLTEPFSLPARQKYVLLSFHSNRDYFWTHFDKDKLEKIVTNLLTNALKFTPSHGAVTVRIQINSLEAGRHMVTIEVSDTGIGIAAEKTDRVFDRFYQVDSSLTREFEGTGIGLALTKELVSLHGGGIQVISAEGAGSTFIVKLPFTEIDRGTQETYSSSAPEIIRHSLASLANTCTDDVPEQRTPSASSDTKLPVLLLVEDNIDLRRYLRLIFSDSYAVMEASDGEAGFELATQLLPDLIISDLMMPKLDGFALCRQLKTDHRTSHVPIILLTARTTIENRLEGLQTGADDYITKPFLIQELQVRANNLVEERKKLRERFEKTFKLSPAEEPLSSVDDKFMQKVLQIIEANYTDADFNVDAFERIIGMSRSNLYRKMQSITNIAPSDFIREYRLKKAAELLSQQCGNISEIAYQVGFNNLSYFTKTFKETYGVTPSKYLVTNKNGSKRNG